MTWVNDINKLKRILIILPLLAVYCYAIIAMVMNGKFNEALLSIGPVVSGILFYYFGDHKSGNPAISKPDQGD